MDSADFMGKADLKYNTAGGKAAKAEYEEGEAQTSGRPAEIAGTPDICEEPAN